MGNEIIYNLVFSMPRMSRSINLPNSLAALRYSDGTRSLSCADNHGEETERKSHTTRQARKKGDMLPNLKRSLSAQRRE